MDLHTNLYSPAFHYHNDQGQYSFSRKGGPMVVVLINMGMVLINGVVLFKNNHNSTIYHYERTLLSPSTNMFKALRKRMMSFGDKPTFSTGDEHA